MPLVVLLSAGSEKVSAVLRPDTLTVESLAVNDRRVTADTVVKSVPYGSKAMEITVVLTLPLLVLPNTPLGSASNEDVELGAASDEENSPVLALLSESTRVDML